LKNFIRIFLLILLILLLTFTVNAQVANVELKPNTNIQAAGLKHYLNTTKDTLILKSDKKINYLYSINKDHQRALELFINANSYKLALNQLPKGKHVLVAVQSPMRIIFVVHVLEKWPVANTETPTRARTSSLDFTELASTEQSH